MRLFGLAFLVAFLAFCFEAAQAADSIKIGVGIPLSGAVASAGEDIRKGFQAAVDDVNAAGGVLGRPVEVIFEDDACDAKQGLTVAGRFAARNVAMVSHLCSPVCMAAKDVYRDSNILLIAAGCSNNALTAEGSLLINRAYPSVNDYAGVVVDYILNDTNKRRIAYVTDREGFMTDMAERVRGLLQEKHVEAVDSIPFNGGERDFSSTIARLKQKKADLVVLSAWPSELGLFVRQARQAGLRADIVTEDAATTDTVPQIAGKALDGVAFVFLPDFSATALSKATLVSLRGNQLALSPLTLFPYAVTQAFVVAANKAGSVEPTKVAAILRHNRFATVVGEIGFDDKGNLVGLTPIMFRFDASGHYRPVGK